MPKAEDPKILIDAPKNKFLKLFEKFFKFDILSQDGQRNARNFAVKMFVSNMILLPSAVIMASSLGVINIVLPIILFTNAALVTSWVSTGFAIYVAMKENAIAKEIKGLQIFKQTLLTNICPSILSVQELLESINQAADTAQLLEVLNKTFNESDIHDELISNEAAFLKARREILSDIVESFSRNAPRLINDQQIAMGNYRNDIGKLINFSFCYLTLLESPELLPNVDREDIYEEFIKLKEDLNKKIVTSHETVDDSWENLMEGMEEFFDAFAKDQHESHSEFTKLGLVNHRLAEAEEAMSKLFRAINDAKLESSPRQVAELLGQFEAAKSDIYGEVAEKESTLRRRRTGAAEGGLEIHDHEASRLLAAGQGHEKRD